MARCPGCRRLLKTRPSWARRLLAALRILPFRCAACRNGSLEGEADADLGVARRRAHLFSRFLKPDGSLGHEDLIEEIARAERRGKPEAP